MKRFRSSFSTGSVSGAHLNPAVTLALAVRRNFPWKRVPGYIIGQVVRGISLPSAGQNQC
jgi:aquaporin Z